ncbi:hypothetical protein ZORO111902_03335 [Zobellia roscoffensis]
MKHVVSKSTKPIFCSSYLLMNAESTRQSFKNQDADD